MLSEAAEVQPSIKLEVGLPKNETKKKQQTHKAKEVTHAFVPHGRRFPAGSLGAVCHRFNFPCRLPASTRVAPLTGCCSQLGCRDASYHISIRHEL